MRAIFKKYNEISLSKRIIVGSIIGIILGFVLQENAKNIKFLGDIFVNLVKMTVPLVIFTAIVEAIASLSMEDLKSIGGKTIFWFAITTAAASLLTFVAVKFIPITATIGNLAELPEYTGTIGNSSITEIIVSFFPDNALLAIGKANITQIIVFATFFGISTNLLRHDVPAVETVYQMIVGLRRIIMRLVGMVMGFAPIGIAASLAATIGVQGAEILGSLGQALLMVTVLDIIFFAGYTLYMCIRFRLNLKQLISNTKNIMVIAFTTGSSAVTLPVSMEEVPKYVGVNEKVSNFVLPLGNALNTNGAPISNIVSAVAVAVLTDVPITTSFLVMVSIYAFISAFGNPGVPGGGVVSLSVVLVMAGLSLEYLPMFFAVDYFYSLTRVVVNVMGNVYSSIYVGVKSDEFDRDIFNASLSSKVD